MANGCPMKRVFSLSITTFILASLLQCLTLHIPLWLNVFFLPSIVIVFIVQYYRPIEIVIACILCGSTIDALGGFLIGYNISLMLMFSFAASFSGVITARRSWYELSLFVIPMSFGYRLANLLAEILFFKSSGNVYIVQLFLGPIFDWPVAIIVYFILTKLLTFFKIFDFGDFVRRPASRFS
jgi:hypothetical protein